MSDIDKHQLYLFEQHIQKEHQIVCNMCKKPFTCKSKKRVFCDDCRGVRYQNYLTRLREQRK